MKTLEEIIAEVTPEKLQQIEKIRNKIDWKIANKIPLNEEEKQKHCEERTWFYKSQLPECEEEFFREFLLKDNPNHPLYEEISAENRLKFGALLIHWNNLMKVGNLSDPIIKAERGEFKYELWQLRKQFSPSTAIFNSHYLDLLEWSKFRSISVRRIFKKFIKSEEVIFSLNNESIVYNCKSLTHIIARHYAHGMKPYHSG